LPPPLPQIFPPPLLFFSTMAQECVEGVVLGMEQLKVVCVCVCVCVCVWVAGQWLDGQVYRARDDVC
jgi:hypothetical protein